MLLQQDAHSLRQGVDLRHEVVEQRATETMQEFITRIEKAAVFRSLENLMTFPCIKIQVERGKIQLHGAYFGVADGELSVLDQESKQFVPAVKVV